MPRLFLAALLLAAAGVAPAVVPAAAADLALPPAAAAPVAAGSFPAQFASMVRVSLAQDPFYASRLLQSFDARVAAVAGMTAPAQVRGYLEHAAVGAHPDARAVERLKTRLASSSIDAERASALLLAHALARPGEFGAALDGLEGAKPGLGKRAAGILSQAHGRGDARLLAALRAAGARRPQAAESIYTREGRLEALFDGSRGILDTEAGAAAAPVEAGGYSSYGPDGRPRRSGLLPAKRP